PATTAAAAGKAAAVVVVPAVVAGVSGGGSAAALPAVDGVGGSVMRGDRRWSGGGWCDREVGEIFGVRRKIFAEKISGNGGWPAAAGGGG
nr:hypothetical protein [Tanacetum cinerariifolium]